VHAPTEPPARIEPTSLADYLEALAADPRIVRSRRKIEATVANTGEMIVLDRESGTFRDHLRSHRSFPETAADLKRHFRFMGETGAYFFLYVVGEEVPPHEEWAAAHPRVQRAHEREPRSGPRWRRQVAARLAFDPAQSLGIP
jgi:3-methyladenine DNA glycosylase Tag